MLTSFPLSQRREPRAWAPAGTLQLWPLLILIPSPAPGYSLDSTMQRISFLETDCNIHWIEICPLDTAIHLFNFWGELIFIFLFLFLHPFLYLFLFRFRFRFRFRFLFPIPVPPLPDARPVKSTSSHRLVTSSQFSRVLDGSRETGW